MSRLIAIGVFLAAFVTGGGAPPALPRVPSAAYYLKIEGVVGEATDGMIQITGFAWDTKADVGHFAEHLPTETHDGDPSDAPVPITFVKQVDKASPILWQAVADGRAFKSVEVWKNEGDKISLLYELENAMMTRYTIERPAGIPQSQRGRDEFAMFVDRASVTRLAAPIEVRE